MAQELQVDNKIRNSHRHAHPSQLAILFVPLIMFLLIDSSRSESSLNCWLSILLSIFCEKMLILQANAH